MRVATEIWIPTQGGKGIYKKGKRHMVWESPEALSSMDRTTWIRLITVYILKNEKCMWRISHEYLHLWLYLGIGNPVNGISFFRGDILMKKIYKLTQEQNQFACQHLSLVNTFL